MASRKSKGKEKATSSNPPKELATYRRKRSKTHSHEAPLISVEPRIEEENYDHFRFSNGNAEKDFEDYWCDKAVLVERGMVLDHFQGEEFKIKQNMEKRGWEKFAQFSGVAVVMLVQEFYANITEFKKNEKDCICTKVRGVEMELTPKRIAQFFKLSEVKNSSYPFEEDETPDKDTLAEILTGKEGEIWGHKNKLESKRLTPKFKALHFLVCSQIMPIRNTSDVSYKKGLLMYAIDLGVEIDLAKVIFDSIVSSAKNKTGILSLSFGGFITRYIVKKKVDPEQGMEVAKPVGPITATTRERSESQLRRGPAPTLEKHMNQNSDKWEEVSQKFSQIRSDTYFIMRELKRLNDRLDAMGAPDVAAEPSRVSPTNED